MGVNGAGKSTLLKLIAGETAPDEGAVSVGPSVKLGYFAQHAMDILDLSRKSVYAARWRSCFRWPARRRVEDAGRLLRLFSDDIDKTLPASSRRGRRRAWCWRASSTRGRTSSRSTSDRNHFDITTKDMIVRSCSPTTTAPYCSVSARSPVLPVKLVEPRAGRLWPLTRPDVRLAAATSTYVPPAAVRARRPACTGWGGGGGGGGGGGAPPP